VIGEELLLLPIAMVSDDDLVVSCVDVATIVA